jgi:HAD superfamily hydrolase (TIGR01509 family)
MPIEAVIFDMDGVLIDAKEWHYEALNRALALFGYTIDHEAHIARFDGLPTKTKLDMLSQEVQLPRSLHRFINRMKQHYTNELIAERLCPTPEHVYATWRLRMEGLRLAVASNSIRATVEFMIRKAELTKYFEYLLSNEDVVNPKPSPQIYQRAMELLGVTPETTLIVEDSPFGLQAAYASGAHVLRVDSVNDVNYHNIRARIQEIDTEQSRKRMASYRKAA